MYIDLDTVIQWNIDDLALYSDGFCGVNTPWNNITTDGDYPYATLRWKRPFNSSFLTFQAEDYWYLWDLFTEDPDYYIMKYYGDDKFLANELPAYDTFPDDEFYSRLYGIDEITPCNDKVKVGPWSSQAVHYYPERKVCLLNGPTSIEHYGGKLQQFWDF